MSQFDWESAEPVQGINALQSQSKGGNSLMLDIASLMPAVPQGVIDWAEGVQHRMAHPLEALSDVANQWKNMSPVEMAANVLPVGATAWHGSPHLFDKFNSEAIGTGEGAQAYGHGLYLAEAPAVAGGYRDKLSINPDPFPVYDGMAHDMKMAGKGGLSAATPMTEAVNALWKAGGNKVAAARQFESVLNNPQFFRDDYVKAAQSKLDILKTLDPTKLTESGGQLYKVDIPDSHIDKMLDWDKPLSEQHPDVQAAIAKIRNDLPLSADGWDAKPWIDSDPLASTFHNQMVQNGLHTQDSISSALHKAGIPGIKYLDGLSRTAGEGTRNFVIFNPDDIRILERNGQPTGQVPWDMESAKPVE